MMASRAPGLGEVGRMARLKQSNGACGCLVGAAPGWLRRWRHLSLEVVSFAAVLGNQPRDLGVRAPFLRPRQRTLAIGGLDVGFGTFREKKPDNLCVLRFAGHREHQRRKS